MHWNPYIDLRCEVSKSSRATCKQCGAGIEKGGWRAVAIDVLAREELMHLDCAAQRAPDVARRKVMDEDPEWPDDAREILGRFVRDDVAPAPRSFQRAPILDLSYDKDAVGLKPCVFCGVACPGEPGPTHGHAVRAFSLDGERRFHPLCVVQLAPGLCKRVVAEDGERWPAEVKAFFAKVLPDSVEPTPRSPWKSTGGLPALQHAPSGRAACRFCREKIGKGELRIAREQMFGMRKSPVYFHVGCYAESDDYHPRMLELLVVRAPAEVTREEIEALGDVLPPTPEEDDDVPPLLERLLAIHDAVAEGRARAVEARAEAESERPRLTKNEIDIPEGFFSS